MSLPLQLGAQLRHRISKGVRAGGQFVPELRSEPSVGLSEVPRASAPSPTVQEAVDAWRQCRTEGRPDLEPVLALTAGHTLATAQVHGAQGIALQGVSPGHVPTLNGVVGPDGAVHPIVLDEGPPTEDLIVRLGQVCVSTVGRRNTTIAPTLPGIAPTMMLRTRAKLRPGQSNPFDSAALDHADDERIRVGLEETFPRLRGFEVRPTGQVGRLFGLLNEHGERLPGALDDRTLRRRAQELLAGCPDNTRTGANWSLNPDGPGEHFHTW
ncbi:hypothetical protein LG293_17105 (plasmid) [Citricoccus nitrophenolicus]